MARPRSRSLGRARKRKRGELASQQQRQDDEEGLDGDRSHHIASAMEANAGFAKSGVVAWPDCDAWRPKSMFDLYYKLIKVVERSEWERFASSLPVGWI